jgi:hypothetical protein
MTDDEILEKLEHIRDIGIISYGENSNVSRLATELIESYKRIKPAPKFIQWTVQTIPKGEPLRMKDWAVGMCFIPITYMLNGLLCFDPDHIKSYLTYDYLLKNGERLDGSPCGEEVES